VKDTGRRSEPFIGAAQDSYDVFPDIEAITRAVQRGVREALLSHKRLGQSICEWRDGRVAVILPEEIDVEEELT
jgi:hypothetical protein